MYYLFVRSNTNESWRIYSLIVKNVSFHSNETTSHMQGFTIYIILCALCALELTKWDFKYFLFNFENHTFFATQTGKNVLKVMLFF